MNQIAKFLLFLSVLFVCVSLNAEEKKSLDDVLAQLNTSEENDDESLLERVKYLEENGEYETARTLLAETLLSRFSVPLVEYWIQADNAKLNSIIIRHSELSEFNRIERTWGEYAKEKTTERITAAKDHPVLTSFDVITNVVTLGGGTNLGGKAHERDKELERVEQMKNMDFGLLTQEQIHSRLSDFDMLKKSVQIIQEILNKELTKSSREQLPTLVNYSKQIRELKEAIRKKHTKFVSYDVISPYLADTTRWLIVSKGKWYVLVFSDKEAFKTAVKSLSLACNQNLLMESSDDVRNQFFEVQKLLKAQTSQEEFEELKVLTTLQDSNDPSKKRGADAWWE